MVSTAVSRDTTLHGGVPATRALKEGNSSWNSGASRVAWRRARYEGVETADCRVAYRGSFPVAWRRARYEGVETFVMMLVSERLPVLHGGVPATRALKHDTVHHILAGVVVAWRRARYEGVETRDPQDLQPAAPLDTSRYAGTDFVSVAASSRHSVRRGFNLFRFLNRWRIPDGRIAVDFNGGQKVTSVVAAALTFNRDIVAQYVPTNDPSNLLCYNIVWNPTAQEVMLAARCVAHWDRHGSPSVRLSSCTRQRRRLLLPAHRLSALVTPSFR